MPPKDAGKGAKESKDDESRNETSLQEINRDKSTGNNDEEQKVDNGETKAPETHNP